MLNVLKRAGEQRRSAERLCDAVTERARAKVFFLDLGVADTIDGRFDLLVLHAWLILDALRDRREPQLAQAFVDTLFGRFDEALRDLGAGDVGMSRRMKKMASAFFGRLEAYRAASGEADLAGALARNVYRGEAHGIEPAARLVTYCTSVRAGLAQSRVEAGEADFGPLPAA